MATLNDLLNVPGVVAAGRWEAADTKNDQPPKILESVGNPALDDHDTLAAVAYLESNGITAAAQAWLWDNLAHSSIKMSPVEGIAIMGPTHTFAATRNRVGVCIDNSANVDMWELARLQNAVA